MTDMAALVEHCAAVLSEVVTNPAQISGRDLTDLQEVVCIYYIAILLSHMEDIEESRIMPLIEKTNIVSILLSFLDIHWQALQPADWEKAAEALSLVFDSEVFASNEDKYFTGDDDVKHLVQFHDSVIAEMVEDNRDVRRKLRPMLDVVDDLRD